MKKTIKDFVSEKGCHLCAFFYPFSIWDNKAFCSVMGCIISDFEYLACPKDQFSNLYKCADCNCCDYLNGLCQASHFGGDYGEFINSVLFSGCPLNKWGKK